MNHEKCDVLGRAILEQFFRPQQVIQHYSLGTFAGDWQVLKNSVEEWWAAYKKWEEQDTLADAYKEQRLTVKGTSEMNDKIQAHSPKKPNERYAEGADWGSSTSFASPIVKTNASIMARLDPEVFIPRDIARQPLDSRKTELGYHDLSALLLNPQVNISSQQYKGRGQIAPEQLYVFMPLSYALDQAVFQNINLLAKACRGEQQAFYNRVREIRSEMTRIKLAAEHDMAVAFVMVGKNEISGSLKFKYTLLSQTDISRRDEAAGLVPKDTFKCKLTDARFDEALKGENLRPEHKKDLQERLKKAGLFDQAYIPDEFQRKVEQAVAPLPAKSKWTKVVPLPEDVVRGKELILEKIAGKTKQNWPTTQAIFEARQNAAINFQSLVLGEMMRYAEVTLAYRKHAGSFPKFARFDQRNSCWIVGTVDAQNQWTPKRPSETFADRPV